MLPAFDPATKVWSGIHRPPLLNSEASLGQVILHTLSLNPSKEIQIDADTGRSMTNGELQLRAIRVVQNLKELGFCKGDMVTMACANSENVAPLAVGLLINGMPFNTLSPSYGVDDMVHMMKITQPKLVFCDANNYETIKQAVALAVKDKPLVYVFESGEMDCVKRVEDLLKVTGRELFFVPPYLGDSHQLIAMILCSSGTTGLPKGVCLSHAHLITIYGNRMPGYNFKLLFNFSPLYWGSGVYTLLTSLMSGITRLITRQPFSEDLCFDLLERYPVDGLFTPPSYAHLLLQHPRLKTANWSNIRLWALGGSAASEQIRNSMNALLPNGKASNGLGISEIGRVSFGQKPFAVGMLLPNIKGKIVDEDGAALENGVRGELMLKFSVKILGYYNNPEANAESIDEEGWLRTGDIAYFDEEGYLFLVDRKKDMLKYRNYQISPSDLESIVAKIDGVSHVCVVGVPDEDGASDLATAVIVKTQGSQLNEADVLNTVNEQVADYKRLRGGVFFVEDIPMTATGKPLRRKLREIVISMIKSRES
ncbi:4-coumarate-CoA ligase 3 [Culex quinquefasciatus]|uniref:4-coumarate-CoA ligase 3 n=1 Tax=Culex quinquefasciatus TaxID=7176 RepID=B0X7N7_CULQU|nr:4-coumarate-CoA ligase 3 [Culex quinquefasciatus]|eukprot:XP_001865659.1 4-coumarate-CoA ligase 3 [Culex quinquefasciatus]